MTPRYLFEEMTFAEAQEAVSYVLQWELHPQTREHAKALVDAMQNWVCPAAVMGQDLGWLKPPLDKVIRGHHG